MTAVVKVIHKFAKISSEGRSGVEIVDTTSKSPSSWQRDLSPFHLGPCKMYGGRYSICMENAWQFSKVYKKHLDENGEPNREYWKWSYLGWADDQPHRYPMGKGAVPEYSFWDGEKLDYVDARKVIYGPLYIKSVRKTEGWKKLKRLYKEVDCLYLRDWDGWSMSNAKLETLTDVLNCPHKKMGHAFVLQMMLQKDDALQEMRL